MADAIGSDLWLTRDKAMIDQLKSIGIEKGKPFKPDAKTTEVLNAAATEAKEFLEQMYDAGFPPFFPDARWASPAWPELVKAGSELKEADVTFEKGTSRPREISRQISGTRQLHTRDRS